MHILDEVLEEYKYSWPFINIERIIKEQWIILEFLELNKIHWLCFEGEKWWYIAVNINLDYPMQRFIMAHELAHALLWEKEFEPMLLSSSDTKEKRADNFAMAILIPENSLKEEACYCCDVSSLSKLFWVPKNIMKERIKKIKALI